jgi:thiol-disulfide isomerase/thioredoxin
MRRLPVLIACCMLAAALLTGCGGDEPAGDVPTPAEARAALRDAPAPLAALHAQASELLPGGEAAFDRRLAELRGHPVVVNVWATWCGPCKQEFPYFQRAAVRYGNRVAFLGVDAQDVREDALAWLDRRFVAYPSYSDPDEEIARKVGAVVGLPTTVYFDANGERAYAHQGVYKDDAALESDLQRYLGAVPTS